MRVGRARAASSCAWSMTRGSGAVTGTGCLSLDSTPAGVGVGTGPVGELTPCRVLVSSCSSSRRAPVLVEAGVGGVVIQNWCSASYVLGTIP